MNTAIIIFFVIYGIISINHFIRAYRIMESIEKIYDKDTLKTIDIFKNLYFSFFIALNSIFWFVPLLFIKKNTNENRKTNKNSPYSLRIDLEHNKNEIGKYLKSEFIQYGIVKEDVDILVDEDFNFIINNFELYAYRKVIQDKEIIMYFNSEKSELIEFHLPNKNILVSYNHEEWSLFKDTYEYKKYEKGD